MRALTVKQPWADLIMSGVKPVENRTWPVPSTLPQWRRCSSCGTRSRMAWDKSMEVPCPAHDPPVATEPDGPFPFRLLIHAGKTYPHRDDAPEAWQAYQDHVGIARDDSTDPDYYEPWTGVLRGHVTVTGCHHADECQHDRFAQSGDGPGGHVRRAYCSRWAEPDMWHWELADPEPLDEPIPIRGMLGLWRLPEGVPA